MPLHRICVDGAVRRSADARANGRRCNACGQALLETLVAALALLPLLLALGLLAKHLDVRHAVVSASRYLAFECTAHPDGCAAGADASALADDVRRRFFDDPVHPIASADPPPDPDAAALGESFWFDRTRRPLLERFGDVASELRQPSFDAAGAAVRSQGERAHPGAVSALAQAGPSRFGLEIADGLIAADVVLRLAASRDCAAGSSVCCPFR